MEHSPHVIGAPLPPITALADALERQWGGAHEYALEIGITEGEIAGFREAMLE